MLAVLSIRRGSRFALTCQLPFLTIGYSKFLFSSLLSLAFPGRQNLTLNSPHPTRGRFASWLKLKTINIYLPKSRMSLVTERRLGRVLIVNTLTIVRDCHVLTHNYNEMA